MEGMTVKEVNGAMKKKHAVSVKLVFPTLPAFSKTVESNQGLVFQSGINVHCLQLL